MGLGGFSHALESLAGQQVTVAAALDGYGGSWVILNEEHVKHAEEICGDIHHGQFAPACRTFTPARRSDEHGHVKQLRSDAHACPLGWGDREADDEANEIVKDW